MGVASTTRPRFCALTCWDESCEPRLVENGRPVETARARSPKLNRRRVLGPFSPLVDQPMTEPSQLRQSSVDVAGVNSPVLEAGPGGASESVVFVHGNPGAGRDWEDLLRRVGEVARAIAPDMPGYGGADKPKSFDYTVTG